MVQNLLQSDTEMDILNKMKEITEKERSGLEEMRRLNNVFLESTEGSKEVRSHLSTVIEDEKLMLAYLKGRKYRPKYAWETLKRKAEVRFDQYPEIFDNKPTPQALIDMQLDGHIGVLKGRDRLDRRIMVFRSSAWNTNEIDIEQLTTSGTLAMEVLLADDDAISNGVVGIQDCSGLGMNHLKQYTLPAMIRYVNIFLYAFPLKIKGLYFLNVPFYMLCLYGIIKPFLPKKIKERVYISTSGKNLDHLHKDISPEILPKFLGGDVKNFDALDEKISYSLNPRFN